MLILESPQRAQRRGAVFVRPSERFDTNVIKAWSPASWIRRNPLAAYFVLAYAISWAFMLPVAASARGFFNTPVPPALYYVASMGPMASAIIVTALTEGRKGLRSLLDGLLRWRVGIRYFAFCVLVPAGLFVLAVMVNRMVTGSWPDLHLLGQMDYLPYLGIPGALGVWSLTYGLGEETGWRGFALPRLQLNRSALSAALLLGLLWGLWHLPAFFFRDTYVEMGIIGFPMFLVSIAFSSVVFTWLYNSTRGSVLMAILFHVSFNWLSVSEAGGQWVPVIMSAAVVAWAVFVIRRYKPGTLSPLKKHTIRTSEG